MNEYRLNFEGYWRGCKRTSIPTYKGVYFVYRCTYNSQNDTVNLIDIIYIGQAGNVHDRLINHEKEHNFRLQLLEGEELCFSCAKVEQDLDIVENALIFVQKPMLNEQGVDSFPYGETHLILSGACTGMKYNDFIIRL